MPLKMFNYFSRSAWFCLIHVNGLIKCLRIRWFCTVYQLTCTTLDTTDMQTCLCADAVKFLDPGFSGTGCKFHSVDRQALCWRLLDSSLASRKERIPAVKVKVCFRDSVLHPTGRNTSSLNAGWELILFHFCNKDASFLQWNQAATLWEAL